MTDFVHYSKHSKYFSGRLEGALLNVDRFLSFQSPFFPFKTPNYSADTRND